jgi:hypothetical protein
MELAGLEPATPGCDLGETLSIRCHELRYALSLRLRGVAAPGALIAGVMGMNFKIGLFEDSWVFYLVLALIFTIAPLTVGFARVREWI